ncbi:MAG: hypothetical protein AAGF32_06530 [Pseudomonadota bacterium]
MAEKKSGRGRPKGSGIDDTPTLIAMADVIRKDPDAKRTTVIKELGITNQSHIRRLRDKFASMEKELLAGKVTVSAEASAAPAAKAERKAMAPASKTPVRKSAAPKAKAKPAARTAAKPAAKPAVKAAAKAAPKAAARTMNTAAEKATKTATRVTKRATKAVSAQRDAVNAAAKAQSQTADAMAAATRDTASMASGMTAAMNGMAPFTAMPWMNAGLETAVTRMVENQISLYETAMKTSPVAAFLRQQALMMDMALSMMKSQQQWAKSSQAGAH